VLRPPWQELDGDESIPSSIGWGSVVLTIGAIRAGRGISDTSTILSLASLAVAMPSVRPYCDRLQRVGEVPTCRTPVGCRPLRVRLGLPFPGRNLTAGLTGSEAS